MAHMFNLVMLQSEELPFVSSFYQFAYTGYGLATSR
jgi:hypothetical protein